MSAVRTLHNFILSVWLVVFSSTDVVVISAFPITSTTISSTPQERAPSSAAAAVCSHNKRGHYRFFSKHQRRISTYANTQSDKIDNNSQRTNPTTKATLAVSLAIAFAVATTVATAPLPSYAYTPSDYASETVQTAVQDLKSASGKMDETFKAYESIAGISK